VLTEKGVPRERIFVDSFGNKESVLLYHFVKESERVQKNYAYLNKEI